LFLATCVLSEDEFALDADWLLSVLGVVAAVAELLSLVEVVLELLVADWLVLGVVFAAAVLSEVLGVVEAELLEVLVCGGTAWFDIVLAVEDP
jgi:hypothetical protein